MGTCRPEGFRRFGVFRIGFSVCRFKNIRRRRDAIRSSPRDFLCIRETAAFLPALFSGTAATRAALTRIRLRRVFFNGTHQGNRKRQERRADRNLNRKANMPAAEMIPSIRAPTIHKRSSDHLPGPPNTRCMLPARSPRQERLPSCIRHHNQFRPFRSTGKHISRYFIENGRL